MRSDQADQNPLVIHADAWQTNILRLKVRQEHINSIDASEPIWHQLVFRGMAHIWLAESQGGKTLICRDVARSLGSCGYEVFYYQLDTPQGQIKEQFLESVEYQYHLITPMDAGTHDRDAVDSLQKVAGEAEDLTDTVFILDTKKKFVDVNSKTDVAMFGAMVRMLTRKGATVISLAHPKKYKEDGKLVPDGVGDFLRDTDNFTFFNSTHDDNALTIVTESRPEYGGKARGKGLTDLKFKIPKPPNPPVIEIIGEGGNDALNLDQQEEKDIPVIEQIREVLADGEQNQDGIIRQRGKISQRQMRAVLSRYAGKHWLVERGPNNSNIYQLAKWDSVQTDKTA